MSNFVFSADRQLMFYVNINGQQRLVQFGTRNGNGTSVFQTSLHSTAEAIRRHSLFKRGVITEFVEEKPAGETAGTVARRLAEKPQDTVEPAVEAAGTAEDAVVIEAKNFTQAKSLLAKRLDMKYNEIKTPEQLIQLAKDNGITIKY